MATARLALYGGSFDPIHCGHLILARDALEELALDRVIMLPAAVSPHKLSRTPTAGAIRHAMTAAAIADEPRLTLDPRELHRPGPSYAIDTVEEIHRENPGTRLLYLIGADNLEKLHTWHRIAELHERVEWVVFDRGKTPSHPYRSLARRLDISSTEIRERVAMGRSIEYLVPGPVVRLIEKHHLYQPPHHRT